MKIYRVTDAEFAQYGRVLSMDTAEIISVAEKIEMPAEGSLYEAARPDFEALPIMKITERELFGEIPAQLGYCWGHSHQLNALEWHKCSELNIAVTDLILLLGDLRELEKDNAYNSENVKAFLVRRGEAIEVYSTTLHFCPIETEKTGFGCVVGLLRGTNTNLEEKPDDPLLFRKNKWIIAHKDNAGLIARGVVGTIYGENYTL